jgi:hypothetical protein
MEGIYIYIHGDSGGKFTVIVLVIVKKNYMNICIILNGYLQRELFESTNTKAL